MPLYEYVCSNCHTAFELRRSIQQKDDAACPDCNSPRGARQIATIATFTRGERNVCAVDGGPAYGCGDACACGHSPNG